MTALAPPGAAAHAAQPLLEIDDLRVHFVTSRGVVKAVDGVSYKVNPGEIVAVVGESGCGKSVTALSVMRLLAKPAGQIVGGRVMFQGRDLLTLGDEQMREIRGRDVAMIFQEPMTSLNPVLTIGLQIMEPLLIHMNMTEAQARARAVELLGLVGITDGERRLDQYPHQFSGGMRQRVMIAIGLACNPKLLIADEPTTALDVTIQAQILELMRELSQRLGIAMIFITHNLGVVARYADRINVMYAARIVEQGTAAAVFAKPLHPYTVGLLRSVPRLDRPRDARLATIEGLPPNLLEPPTGCRFAARCAAKMPICDTDPALVDVERTHRSACHRAAELARGQATSMGLGTVPADAIGHAPLQTDKPLLEVVRLKKFFTVARKGPGAEAAVVRAVNDVSFNVYPGETLGLVGESGCGKTTIGRNILKLDAPTEGEIRYDGRDLARASKREMQAVRRRIQVIFQDPYSSLNPRMTVGQIIGEPLHVYRLEPTRKAAAERVADLLTQVGLFPYMAERYPHELSGGQRQRVGIARALAMKPDFIVCDEPVSALDVSIQGQIINLLEDLQARYGLTYLFIAHDLAVVRHISDRVVVMYLGRIMEVASRDDIYLNPRHPYTKALLDAAPIPDPEVERTRQPRALKGELPSPLNPPAGCVFHTRCPLASEECRQVIPELRSVGAGHHAACIKV
ncbi:MAG: ABC transporter ATP-binding protein [Alphaproteobacteria bacterium]|nr:ABC transporter ATP-binding protein [Alphaproteobacteria bacterium]